jgi:hypothetical protein
MAATATLTEGEGVTLRAGPSWRPGGTGFCVVQVAPVPVTSTGTWAPCHWMTPETATEMGFAPAGTTAPSEVRVPPLAMPYVERLSSVPPEFAA